jgi:hypothetical protein
MSALSNEGELDRMAIVSLLDYVKEEVIKVDPVAAYLIGLGASLLDGNTIDVALRCHANFPTNDVQFPMQGKGVA